MASVPSTDVVTARLSDAPLRPAGDVTGMWPGRCVDIGGSELFVRSTPPVDDDAEPAVFVHGLGGAAPNWTDVAGRLRGHLAIDAVDLPGFGRSGPAPHDDYSLGAHARAVISYIVRSGRGPVHLAGNSMGGAVSILVAATRPDLVRTLTLISPAVPDNNRLRVHALRGDPRMALLVFPGLGGMAMKRAAGVSPELQVRAMGQLVFGDASRYPQARVAEAVEEARARQDVAWANTAFLRSLRGLVRSQFASNRRGWRLMGRIAAPTLVIWGDRDRLVAPALAAEVARTIPDARLLMLPGVGHVAMMEDPDITARAMLALIEDAGTA